MSKLFLTLLLAFPLFASAQSFVQLGERAEISVLTLGPSQEELYSAFGHSSFRVYDPDQNIDEAYNYGVFDFDQPNFYLNFAKGYLYYKLGVFDYQRFKNHYIRDNRYVHEQVLNLTPAQKQTMYNYLQRNALPEFEHYRYDYFYNNCATKIRDVTAEALAADSVKFDGSYITTNYTIRDLTDIYLKQQPWGDLGIDICLGLPMDKTAAPHEYMFLPDYVESSFAHGSIIQNGIRVPIVKEKISVNESREENPEEGLPHPLYIFGALMIIALVISFLDERNKKLSIWFDVLLFSVAGLIGILLFFLWLATDHQAAARNFNLLWAVPLHIIAIPAMITGSPRWLKSYFLGIAILSAFTLLTWPILPQRLNYMLIPVVITLGVRAFMQYRIRKRNANP